jgi:hypothetical protein
VEGKPQSGPSDAFFNGSLPEFASKKGVFTCSSDNIIKKETSQLGGVNKI